MQPTLKVFLFAGQSNMVGSDAHPERIDDFPRFRGAGAPQPEVRFATLSDDPAEGFRGWGPLQPRDAFGPELTFARTVLRADRTPLAIVKSAIGGTTAAFDWNPDAPESGRKLYPRTLRLLREALRALDREGIRHRFEGVVWHQGENDMLDRRINTHYAEHLRALVARLRSDLDAPRMKWYVGEVSEKGIWGMDNRANLAILREQQQQVLDADPHLRWVPTSHLAFDVMDSGQPHYHFGTQGQLQMGVAFAEAYLQEIRKGDTPKPRSLSSRSMPPRRSRVRLFVLAGQRNMEGEDAFVAQIDRHPPHRALGRARSDVLFRVSLGGGVYRSERWEPLGPVDPLGNFGPELSLGARLREAIPAREGIALVKFTHSGAQIPDWSPTGSAEARRDLYPRFVAFVRDAVQDLARRGIDATVEGVFWHPGENDTWFTPYQRGYADRLRTLAERLRADLGRPSLPWFVSEQHPRAIWKHMAALNADLRTLAAADTHLHIVPTGDLDHQRVHFGTLGTLQLGEAYARAWRETVERR